MMKRMMRTVSNRSQVVHARGRRRGQAIVEMAFVVMILLSLTMGMLQYGVIYNTNIQLTNLAREGARYAAVHATESTAATQTRTYLRDIATRTVISQSSLTDDKIAFTTGTGGATAGSPITITIYYDMRKKFFLPVPGWAGLNDPRWTNKPYSATMLIE